MSTTTMGNSQVARCQVNDDDYFDLTDKHESLVRLCQELVFELRNTDCPEAARALLEAIARLVGK